MKGKRFACVVAVVAAAGFSGCASASNDECTMLDTTCEGTKVMLCALSTEDGKSHTEFTEDVDCADRSDGKTDCAIVDGEAECVESP